MTNTKSNELYSVCYLRCFSMFLIVLCHLAQKSSNVYIQMSSQFLNVGVSIFFIISGYLFGLRKIEIEYKKWYLKRIIRILPSFYLFLIILFCIYLILKKDIRLTSWIIYLFDLQAFLGYVRGAEHLWFLSIIAICYFITPILDWIKSNLKKTTKLFLFSLIILFQIIVTFFIEKQLGIYLFKVNIYILAYIFGSVKFECENLSEFIFSLVLCLLGASLRISGKIMIDGTVMYDVMLVGITQAMIAFGLFFPFSFCLIENLEE